MPIEPLETKKVITKKAIIISALLSSVFIVVFLGSLSLWIFTHHDELRGRQMYLQVGAAVVQHWPALENAGD